MNKKSIKISEFHQGNRNAEIGLFKEICYKEFKGNISSLILFGSQAKGKGTKESDYDFLILTKKGGNPAGIKSRLLLNSFKKMHRPLHLVIKSEEDFSLSLENLSPFALEIMDSGKTIGGKKIIEEKLPFFRHLLYSKKIQKIVFKGMEAWKTAA